VVRQDRRLVREEEPKPLNAKAINNCGATLSVILVSAVEWGLCELSPGSR
jgi:hypothetical protein